MDPNAASDLAFLEGYFDEMKLWPSSYTLTAAMWPTLSRRVKDSLEADLTEAGYDWTTVKAVEYEDGKLISVTVRIP